MTNVTSQFHENGYVGPLRLKSAEIPPQELAAVAEQLATGSPLTGDCMYARHLDMKQVFELCTDSRILRVLRLIIGPDIVLWNSSFWITRPHSRVTPWHQDIHYWPTALTFTCWIALTDTSETTGCLVVAPRSHTHIAPVVDGGPEAKFEKITDPAHVARWQARPLPMKAGEFVILSDRILHASAANTGHADRLALAARFTVPSVKIRSDHLPLFPGHHSILVSGIDGFGINHLGPAP